MVGRRIAAVGIRGDVVQGQDKAIVDIADADAGLVDFFRLKIVARREYYGPVGRDLQGGRAKYAVAAGEEPELGLWRVFAIHQRHLPTVVIGAPFDFKTADLERLLGKPKAGTEHVGSGRLVGK